MKNIQMLNKIAKVGTDLLDPAIRRYRMRLILPVSMYEHLLTVQELGYDNWQIIR